MPFYNSYGLTIRSDIALPALQQVEIDASHPDGAQIVIEGAAIAPDAGGENKFRNWEAGPDRFLTHFFNVARFLVTDGDRIRYDREAGVDDSQIVSALLGTCMGALLMQRRILPIHSCCVLTDRGAVLVMGRSGAGKSTTLGGLLDLGYKMMADDVTGLTVDEDGTPMAIPAFPSVRLWKDSLQRLGHKPHGLAKVRSDMEKFYLPIERFHNSPEPIRAIIHITANNGADISLEEIQPAHRIEALSRFIFRKSFIDGLELRRFAFSTIASTINRVAMLRVIRPARPIVPSVLARTIMDELEQTEARQMAETAMND